MADSSFVGANVVVETDTFRDWLDRTNQLIYVLSTDVVTAKANSTGAVTTGNAHVNGIFSANTLVAKTALRGGTVAASANLDISSNAVFAANVFITGALAGNTAAFVGLITANTINATGAVTFNALLTANTANVQGAKNFGNVNTVSFAEANSSNRGKVLRISPSADLLEFASFNLDDLGDVTTAGGANGYVLTYNNANSTFYLGPPTSGGNTVTGNTGQIGYDFEAGNLGNIGGTGYAIDLHLDTGSNTSSLDIKADAITVNAISSWGLGAIGKLRLTGGANNQFVQQLNSTTGTLQFTTVDKDFIFPDAAVTTLGANVFSIDRNNGRVGVGTNAVPASYKLGVLGNFHANGDILVTGNTSVTGNVAAASFIGQHVGATVGTTASFSGNVVPTANGGQLGNTISKWAILGTTLDLSSTLNVTGLTTLAGANATGVLEIRGTGVAYSNVVPSANAINLGNTVSRWNVAASSIDVSGAATVGGLTTTATLNVTSTADLRGLTTAYANVVPSANGGFLGVTTRRWELNANTGDFAGTLNVTGLATLATANVTGAYQLRGVGTLFANLVATTNAAAVQIGNTIGRVILVANTGDFSSTLNVSGLTTLSTSNTTGASELRGVTTFFANAVPTGNTTNLGNTISRWVLIANTGDFSSTLNVSGLATLATANVTGVITLNGVATALANIQANGDIFYSTIPNGSANSVGLRNIIPNNQNAEYTLTKADNNRMCRFSNTTGNTYTIANNSTTSYDLGHITIVRNVGTGVLRIAPGTGVTLRLAANSSNVTANVAQWGYASVVQEATDQWIISGSGVT